MFRASVVSLNLGHAYATAVQTVRTFSIHGMRMFFGHPFVQMSIRICGSGTTWLAFVKIRFRHSSTCLRAPSEIRQMWIGSSHPDEQQGCAELSVDSLLEFGTS